VLEPRKRDEAHAEQQEREYDDADPQQQPRRAQRRSPP
jgi:hypothetical protein